MKKLKFQFEKSVQIKNNKELEKLKSELLKKDNEMQKRQANANWKSKARKRINEMAKQIKQKSVEYKVKSKKN